MKRLLYFFAVIVVSVNAIGQGHPKTSARDFTPLIGYWKGSLTYLDYSSGKQYTMSADLEVSQIGQSNSFLFANIYPKEPKANSTDTLLISDDGMYINKERIVSKRKLKDDETEITTEVSGYDGNDHKAAVIRHTYTISKKRFSMRKDVRFEGEEKWLQRHEYAYSK